MDEKIVTKDSNGNVLAEGDGVLLTKDLKVKGFNKDLKRGTLIKNIRLTSDPGEIEGKVEGSVLVVKTMYLKKK
ncbi:MAG: alkylphosphonate utilization protein [Saprospiraceae bacterium]